MLQYANKWTEPPFYMVFDWFRYPFNYKKKVTFHPRNSISLTLCAMLCVWECLRACVHVCILSVFFFFFFVLFFLDRKKKKLKFAVIFLCQWRRCQRPIPCHAMPCPGSATTVYGEYNNSDFPEQKSRKEEKYKRVTKQLKRSATTFGAPFHFARSQACSFSRPILD